MILFLMGWLSVNRNTPLHYTRISLSWMTDNMHNGIEHKMLKHVFMQTKTQTGPQNRNRHVCCEYEHVLARLPGSSLCRARGLNEAF